jgi:hypothetical protein
VQLLVGEIRRRVGKIGVKYVRSTAVIFGPPMKVHINSAQSAVEPVAYVQ